MKLLALTLLLAGCAPKAIIVEPVPIAKHIETFAKSKHCP